MAINTTKPQTKEDWLGCIRLPLYYGVIPAGRNRMITGMVMWMDGEGESLTTKAYVAKWSKLMGFKVDPEVIWAAKMEYRRTHGGGVHYTRP